MRSREVPEVDANMKVSCEHLDAVLLSTENGNYDVRQKLNLPGASKTYNSWVGMKKACHVLDRSVLFPFRNIYKKKIY